MLCWKLNKEFMSNTRKKFDILASLNFQQNYFQRSVSNKILDSFFPYYNVR